MNLAEVNPIGRASKIPGANGHKRTHELAGVHGTQEVALHVFAQLLFARLGAVLVNPLGVGLVAG